MTVAGWHLTDHHTGQTITYTATETDARTIADAWNPTKENNMMATEEDAGTPRGNYRVGTTTMRNFRVDDAVWEAAAARAEAEGGTVTAVLVRALERYGKTHRKTAE
jgi:hypothetical protein